MKKTTKQDDDVKQSHENEVTTESIEQTEEENIKNTDEISVLQTALSDINNKYLRALADIENIKKREEKAKSDISKFAINDFAKEILEVLDVFNKALSDIDTDKLEDDSIKSFFDGIKMTKQVLEKTLHKFGVIEINPLEEQFDPTFHETLYAVSKEGEENGKIVEVISVGYKIHDRLLRSAKVAIIKN